MTPSLSSNVGVMGSGPIGLDAQPEDISSNLGPVAGALGSEGKNVFILAAQIEEILRGQSNTAVMKILNVVGALHGARTISVNRPIGQTTAGAILKKVVPIKPKKGQSTPPAAWKQTDDYRRLNANHKVAIANLKKVPPQSDKTGALEALRSIERELKDLHAPRSGD